MPGLSTLSVVCEGELASLALLSSVSKPLLHVDPSVQKEHECLGKQRLWAEPPLSAQRCRGAGPQGVSAHAGAAATGTAPRFECPVSTRFESPEQCHSPDPPPART